MANIHEHLMALYSIISGPCRGGAHTVPFHNKEIYRKYYIRNSDPGFLICFLLFPCFFLAFPGKFKKFPDPGRIAHISYHTAEPYSIIMTYAAL